MIRTATLILLATLVAANAQAMNTHPDPQTAPPTSGSRGLALDRELFLVRTETRVIYGAAANARLFVFLRVRVAVVFELSVRNFPTAKLLTETDAGSRPLEPLMVKLRNGLSWTT